jgi:hypothetical protein
MKQQRWVKLEEILENPDVQPFEVLEAIEENELTGYSSKTGAQISYDKGKNQLKIEGLNTFDQTCVDLAIECFYRDKPSGFLLCNSSYDSLGSIIFKFSDVEKYEKERGVKLLPTIQNHGIKPAAKLMDLVNPDTDYSQLKLDERRKFARQWKENGFTWKEIAEILLPHEIENMKAKGGSWNESSTRSKVMRWAQEGGYKPENQ